MKNKTILLILVFFNTFFCANAASITWTDGTGNGFFNTAANWSTGTVPGPADIMIFDGFTSATCTLNVNVDVAGFHINLGYAGTIVQELGITVTVGVNHFSQADGVFSGGNSTIDVNGNFILSGGVFQNTSGQFKERFDFTFSGGFFVHNNGEVIFDGINQSITGSPYFAKLTLSLISDGTLTVNNDIFITNTLTLSGSNRTDINNPGILNCLGDINLNGTSFANNGNATINITGIGFPKIISTVSAGRSELPNIIINKTAGKATFGGIISFNRNFTYTSGLVDATTNNSRFHSLGSNTTIDGESTSGINFLFYDLYLTTAAINQTLLGDLEINNEFNLENTRMNMNGNEVTLNNSASGALTASGGGGILQSESTDNSGKIHWNIGSDASNHIFRFGTGSNVIIPFHFEITNGGDVGIVTVSTYPTIPNNTPFPVTPETVTHLTSAITGLDNSSSTIDRFWQIDKSGPTGTATLLFTYSQADVSGAVSGNELLLEAQRYESSINDWQLAPLGQTQNSITNQVTVPSVSTFSPWTLALNTSPLPIELLSFNAFLKFDFIDLTWETASEINNAYFTIEKSTDALNWTSFAKQTGAGNSNSILNYVDVDINPFKGKSYYRLKQTDFNGHFEYSKIVTINNQKEGIITVYPNPVKDILTLTNITKQHNVKVYSSNGQIVYNGNTKTINTETWSKGIYQVIISDKTTGKVIESVKIVK